MKKCIAILLCLLLSLPCLQASASPAKVIDDASLLTDAECASLETKAQALADKYNMDVVIVTIWSLEGKSSEAYADDYFDYNGYGLGNNYSGILLLLSMEYRDWAISTCGDTIDAVTDYGVQSIFLEIAPYLAEDEYFQAFDKYLDELDTYFNAYVMGDPIDGIAGDYDGPGSYVPGTNDNKESIGQRLPKILMISLLIGAAIAGIVLLILRGTMNTAKPQSNAHNYLNHDSYALTHCQDIFIRSTVSRSAKADSSSQGGGGSSVHRGSSGRSHGGGHGKF